MVYFRKRLTSEILGEINELIIDKANPKKEPFPKQDADVKMDDDKQDDDHNDPKPPSNTGTLIPKQGHLLEILKTLYEQQLYMYKNHTHQVADRIVSISQPWLRPIVRGKTKAPVEFGAKLDISISNGFVRLERQSFDAYNESEYLQEVIERYRKRTGSYPQRFT